MATYLTRVEIDTWLAGVSASMPTTDACYPLAWDDVTDMYGEELAELYPRVHPNDRRYLDEGFDFILLSKEGFTPEEMPGVIREREKVFDYFMQKKQSLKQGSDT